MEHTYWHKQSKGQPLYPDLMWSKPENRQFAGKLLIIGGTGHEFAAPAQAYQAAGSAGAGAIRILLPESVKKRVGQFLPEAFYGPSTHSGGFAGAALGSWLELAEWADATLVAGDLGRNSETSVLIEKFLQTYPGRAVLSKDTLDICLHNAKAVLMRPETTLVCAFGQLQKYMSAFGSTEAIRFDAGIGATTETLHDITSSVKADIVSENHSQYIVASKGRISTTHTDEMPHTWQLELAAKAAVWLMQNPGKAFEALTTAVAEM